MRAFTLLFASIVAAVAVAAPARAQWEVRTTGTSAEFRGLDSAGPLVVWAGGAAGAFARSIDGGATRTSDTVPGAGQLYFIDVHAVDANTAYLLGTHFDAGHARIYKTTDGGQTWTRQYERTQQGVFYDGFAFWDARSGIAFGDPVAGSFTIVVTRDGGATWREVPSSSIPAPLQGEAAFAASGRAIAVHGDSSAWFGTGGGRIARVFRSTDRGASWHAAETPLPGGSSAGIFAVTFRDARNGVAVGGDYQAPRADALNVLRTTDGGATWRLASPTRPAGVRYGATFVPGTTPPVLVATGPSGSGFSRDQGATWTAIDTVAFNTVAFASPTAGWAAGTGGRIARFVGDLRTRR